MHAEVCDTRRRVRSHRRFEDDEAPSQRDVEQAHQEEGQARARLMTEIEQSYAETELERRCAIGKIVEIMTTAGDMVDPDERDNYLRKEIVGYLTSK